MLAINNSSEIKSREKKVASYFQVNLVTARDALIATGSAPVKINITLRKHPRSRVPVSRLAVATVAEMNPDLFTRRHFQF